MRLVVIDLLVRYELFGVFAKLMTGIRVRVILREVAARNLDADAVALLEQVAGGPEVNVELVDLVRRQQVLLPKGFVVAPANNSLEQDFGVAVGSDVYDFARKVGVCAIGRSEQMEHDR